MRPQDYPVGAVVEATVRGKRTRLIKTDDTVQPWRAAEGTNRGVARRSSHSLTDVVELLVFNPKDAFEHWGVGDLVSSLRDHSHTCYINVSADRCDLAKIANAIGRSRTPAPPPKIAEPTEFGAVVAADGGYKWVRTGSKERPWLREDNAFTFTWDQIVNPKVVEK